MIRERSLVAALWSALGALVGMLVWSGGAGLAAQQNVPVAVACAPAAGEMLLPVERWALRASGGTTPYTFAISKGELPNGLSLDAVSGRISGTPGGKSGGRTTYTAHVQDSRGVVSQRECDITIAPPPGWQIRVCRQAMRGEAQAIRLRVGIGGLESSHREWTTWTFASDDLLTVPTIFRYARELWIEGTPDPEGKNGVMCVLYNRNVTKALEFDGPDPNEVSREDHDSCSC